MRFLPIVLLLVVLAPRAWSAETVTIVAPNGGETICPNHGEMVVSWSSSGLPDNALINVDLYHNGTLTNHIFRNISPSPSSRKWDQMFASGATGDGYKVRINVVGSPLYDESDAAFNLAHVAPVVTMTAPKGGEQWRLGETHPVEWSWTGCIWGISWIRARSAGRRRPK